MTQNIILLAMAFCAVSAVSADDRLRVQPILETPLRDPAVCRGPDGVYYLTGTVPKDASAEAGKLDFDNNDGVYLWKSADLVNWEPMGNVWSLAGDAGSRWCRQKGVKPGVPDSPMVRGVVSPEIHYLKDTFWIPFSMSHGGTGLLRSETGKAEGPYAYVGMFTAKGTDPSLFQDDDGKVYWVFGEGWVAPMTDDMTDLADAPVLLRPEPETYKCWGERRKPKFADYAPTVGTHGAFLFKANGFYHLTAARHYERLRTTAVHDTFVASAKDLMGPYGPVRLMIAHGGQTTVLTDDEGNLYGTFGGDGMAVFRDRAGIVPLRYDGFLKQVWKPHLTNAINQPVKHPVHRAVVTEGGPLATLRPLHLPGPFDDFIRDPHVLNAPDGHYYLSGTVAHRNMPDPQNPGIYVWKSRDLKTWEAMGEVWNTRSWEGEGAPYRPQPPRFAPHLKQNFEGIWGPRIAYVKGNYYIPWGPAYGGCYMLRSTTGKPEGPYEDMGIEFHGSGIAPTLFEDDNGSVYYLCTGGVSIGRMKDDMSGLAEPLRTIRPADGSDLGFEGPFMVKAHGKYILFLSDRSTVNRRAGTAAYHKFDTYDWMYCWSDSVYGPYSTARCALPHGGCTSTFKSKDGRWHNAFFGSDPTAPFSNHFNVLPINIRRENGEIIISQARPE